jgi:hypothetical protein
MFFEARSLRFWAGHPVVFNKSLLRTQYTPIIAYRNTSHYSAESDISFSFVSLNIRHIEKSFK